MATLHPAALDRWRDESRRRRAALRCPHARPTAQSPACAVGRHSLHLLAPREQSLYRLGDAVWHPTRRVSSNLSELESSGTRWNGTLLHSYWERWGRQHPHWRSKEILRALSQLLTERASRAGTSAASGRATDKLHVHLRLGDAFAVANLTAARVSAWCHDDLARPPWVRPPHQRQPPPTTSRPLKYTGRGH